MNSLFGTNKAGQQELKSVSQLVVFSGVSAVLLLLSLLKIGSAFLSKLTELT